MQLTFDETLLAGRLVDRLNAVLPDGTSLAAEGRFVEFVDTAPS